jgi:exodeoxyribonuclease VIII
MINYFEKPGISQSMLKDFKKSPKYFHAKHILKLPELCEDKKDKNIITKSNSLSFGSAMHASIFEPEKFADEYLQTEIDNRTKAGKESIKSLLEANPNKKLIDLESCEIILKMQASILNKKMAAKILQQGFAERELYWQDYYTGIDCKAKLDYLIEPCSTFKNGLIVDLKTTTDASHDEFAKTCYQYGYYNQLAFYSTAVKTIYQTSNLPNFIFIVIEKTAPYDCAFYYGDEDMLYCGLQENNYLLQQYQQCLEKNKWSGYLDQINQLSMPSWAINKIKFQYINLKEE